MADTLICKQCDYANEPERVYCHNCGGKLDRTLLPKSEPSKEKETPQVTHKRILKMTNPSRGTITREIKALCLTLTWGAILGAFVVMAKTPEGVPAPRADVLDRLVQSEMMDVVESPKPQAVTFSEDEVNASLKRSLKPTQGGGIPGITFERAYVNFLPSVVHVGVHQSLWGYPVYSGENYELQMENGALKATLIAGNIGRLPIHPMLMGSTDFAFQKLWKALKREHEQINKMRQVEVGKGRITLISKGR